jgi:hypothetical protein
MPAVAAPWERDPSVLEHCARDAPPAPSERDELPPPLDDWRALAGALGWTDAETEPMALHLAGATPTREVWLCAVHADWLQGVTRAWSPVGGWSAERWTWVRPRRTLVKPTREATTCKKKARKASKHALPGDRALPGVLSAV